MLDEEFKKRRADLVRELAARADPFTRRRLLDLVPRYEKAPAKTRTPPPVSLGGPGTTRPTRGEKLSDPDPTFVKESIVQRSTLAVLEGVLRKSS
jgi:hypothetical protein